MKTVSFSGRTFFEYDPAGVPRPYIDAVFTVSGARVTRDLATAPEGSDDHLHHKGVWWGHRNVSGSDIWTEFDGHGSIRSDSDATMTTEADSVEIVHRMRWTTADGEPLVLDTRTIRGYAPDAHGVQKLDIELELSATSGSVTLHDTKEAGLVALRVAPELEERRGGRIALSTGANGEAEAWGKRASWCHYTGMVGRTTAGIAVLDHPDNPLPAYWHVRDYGLLAVNPFGLTDFGSSGAPGDLRIGPGAFRAKYRILVHDGVIDVPEYYHSWARQV